MSELPHGLFLPPSPCPHTHTYTNICTLMCLCVCVCLRVCVSKSSTGRQIKISYAFAARRAQRASRPLSPTLFLFLPRPAGHAPHLTRAELQRRQWQLLRHNLPPFQASTTSPPPASPPLTHLKKVSISLLRALDFSFAPSLSSSLAVSLPPSLFSPLFSAWLSFLYYTLTVGIRISHWRAH